MGGDAFKAALRVGRVYISLWKIYNPVIAGDQPANIPIFTVKLSSWCTRFGRALASSLGRDRTDVTCSFDRPRNDDGPHRRASFRETTTSYHHVFRGCARLVWAASWSETGDREAEVYEMHAYTFRHCIRVLC